MHKPPWPVFLLFVLFIGCKKQSATGASDTPPTQAIAFTDTFYETTCTWDGNGRPNCLTTPPDTISPELFNYINTTLPEGKDLRKTNPSLLSSTAPTDVAVTQPSDVYVTFVYQSTSANDAFGYYTFPTGQAPKTAQDIKKITYVFPDVKSNVPLQPGDKVKLGRFDAGTSIGFVLLQDAWDAGLHKPNDNAVHFCTNDALNPETDPALKKHAVLLTYAPENKILLGFEDTNRTLPTCDHDFNDVVLSVTVVH